MSNPSKVVPPANFSNEPQAPALHPPAQHQELELRILNTALGMELAALGRYKACYFLALNLNRPDAAEHFIEHAEDIEDDIDQLVEHILIGGGIAEFSAETLLKNRASDSLAHQRLRELTRGDLRFERDELKHYYELLSALENRYPETERVLKEIQSKKEQRLNALEHTISPLED